jgi:hypothetical protein
MPTELSKKAEQKIRDILVNNWDATNTAGYDPTSTPSDADFVRIHDGTYEASYADPQISITHPNGESVASATNYSGFQGDGSGLNQDRVGNPLIQCWAETLDDGDYRGESAEDIVRLLRLEVERVVQAHASADPEFFYVSVEWDGRNPDNTATPTWQSQLTAQYQWLKEPA